MPLLCHQQPLSIEQQSLVADFINFAIKEDNISEYKLKGKALIQELITFAKTFNEEDEEKPNILEQMRSILLNKNEVDDRVISELS